MIIAPSILTADFTKLATEIKKIESADMIHIDIMDGHFVPNISFGPSIVKQINEMSSLPLDVHLMVTNPLDWVSKFHFNKTKYMTVHVESNDHYEAISKIRELGMRPGISIKPNTSISEILDIIDMVDLVLVMTVEPGFGGQSFMADMMDKVKALIDVRIKKGLSFLIEVDGGVTDKTIQKCRNAGVDIVVAGSYVFNHENAKNAILSLK
ncbi:MAG: ribulose-phosphate 3-epimerase [Acholeplasmataceae bacterium]